jgi:hypothetical protein
MPCRKFLKTIEVPSNRLGGIAVEIELDKWIMRVRNDEARIHWSR